SKSSEGRREAVAGSELCAQNRTQVAARAGDESRIGLGARPIMDGTETRSREGEGIAGERSFGAHQQLQSATLEDGGTFQLVEAPARQRALPQNAQAQPRMLPPQGSGDAAEPERRREVQESEGSEPQRPG